jgi:nucleotide-binding universal stress UspA family protein
MKTVIVGLDGSELSERAIAATRSLSERSGAAVHLLACPWTGVAVDLDRYLQDHATTLRPAAVSTEVSARDPADAIVAAAGTAPDPVVCMATHGRGRVGQVVLGSVAAAVVCRLDVPVLLLGPMCDPAALRRRPAPVVAPTDGSLTAIAMLPAAARWAEAIGAPLTLVQVVGPEESVDPEGCDDVTVEARSCLDAEARRLAALGYPEPLVEVLYGHDAAAAIVARAGELGAAAVAMGTHGTGGVTRAAMGRVASRVVHTAACPVLVVGPGDRGRSS